MRSAELLYRTLLRAYPRDFRQTVGQELLAAFRRGLEEHGSGRLSFCFREASDLLLNLPSEWRESLFGTERRRRTESRRPSSLTSGLLADIRIACRGLFRQPGFAAAAILTFAIGIGANTAVFSLLHTILLDPLPYEDVDRLVLIEGNSMVREEGEGGATYPDPRDWPGVDRAFVGIAEFSSGIGLTLGEESAPERAQGAIVTPGYIQVMGVDPLVGRGFLPGEEGRESERVILIRRGLWMRRFGGDPAIVGKVIEAGGVLRTVVGVMPDHFRFPDSSEVWIPASWDRTTPRTLRHLSAVGRLRPAVSVAQARASLAEALDVLGGAGASENIDVVPLRDWIFGDQKTPVFIFYSIVSLVLLVACLNVASLFLARNETRSHEMAVRTALGAGRFRLVREMLAESLLLAAIGGGLGVAMGWWGRDLILAALPDEIPPYFSFDILPGVLLVMAGIIMASGLLFGLIPTFASRRSDLQGMINAGSRAYSAGKPRRRLWSSLVAAEIALTLTVLISANLMVKSLVRQLDADTGLDASNVVTLRVTPDFSGERLWAFYTRVTEEAAAIPGIDSVGLIQWLETGDNSHWWAAYVEELGRVEDVRYQRCAPGYFSTMGIPLLAGRDFEDRDGFDAPRVVVVNESFAERFWPGEGPVGKRLGRGSAPTSASDGFEVIGVVANVHNASYGRPAEPQVYLPYAQSVLENLFLVARTTLHPPTAMSSLKTTISAIAPGVPLSRFRTMEQAVYEANWQVPFATWTFGLLSLIALVLAATGVYGLVAYTVARRSRDLAIRVAVGADAARLQRMVVRESLALAGAGILTGAMLAMAGVRFLASLLFRVGPMDPAVYMISAAVMVLVVLLASYLPARRILRLEPLTVLGRE
jgi:predicted permease